MAMGEAAAECAAGRSYPRPAAHDAQERLDRLRAAVERHNKGELGASIRDFEYKFRRLVNEYVAPPKSERKLKRFLEETEPMVRDQEDLPAADPHGVMKAFEAKAGLFCARMAARASLFRTESRYGLIHYRVDYPEKDDANWATRVFIRAGDNGPQLTKEGR